MTTSKNRLLLPLIIVAVVVAALVIAVVVSDGDGDTEGLEQTRAVAIAGTPLPPLGDGNPDPASGLPAPRLSGAAFDGTPFSGRPGQARLWVFVAHWCPHCQAEVPRLVDWLDGATTVDGVEVVAVSTAVTPDRPNYPPSAWLDREQFDVPLLADDDRGTAAAAFGVDGFPFFVLTDAQGTVRWRASGEREVAELAGLIAELSA